MQSRRSFLRLLGLASSAAVVSLPAAATLTPSAPKLTPVLPVGYMSYFTANPPPGWLLCDGRAISRTYYRKLFELLGTSHGDGDGVTTFNLPNYWSNAPRWKELPSHSHTLTPLELTTEEIPSHSHGFGHMQHQEMNLMLVRLAIYSGVE
jgi:hypothetical protein